MTMARIILGEVFIAILAIGLVYAVVSPTLQPIILPSLQMPWSIQGSQESERYSLVKGTNVTQSVSLVNLNVTMKFGALAVSFSDDPDLALDATYTHGNDTSQLDANYAADNEALQANLYGETGALNLTLGRAYQYNGTLSLRIGGVLMDLGQYTNISKITVAIRYLGGVSLNVNNGASFEQLDLAVNLGGVQVNVDADHLNRNGAINADIDIGGSIIGVNVDTSHIGVSFEATVDTGGISINHADFTGQKTATQCSLKTSHYETADKKLDITTKIGLGGVTLQPNVQTIPGING